MEADARADKVKVEEIFAPTTQLRTGSDAQSDQKAQKPVRRGRACVFFLNNERARAVLARFKLFVYIASKQNNRLRRCHKTFGGSPKTLASVRRHRDREEAGERERERASHEWSFNIEMTSRIDLSTSRINEP
jgi:hypothetical protein